MNKEEIYELMNENPVFYLATADGDKPKVRGMLLYKADKEGIVFHTGTMKLVYEQLKNNPNVELCFFDMKKWMQVRASGTVEVLEGNRLKEEISAHPSRAFLKGWKESGTIEEFYDSFVVFRLKNAEARTWTMEANLEPSKPIMLD